MGYMLRLLGLGVLAISVLTGTGGRAADLVIAVPNWSSGEATAHILQVAINKQFGIRAQTVEMGTLIAFAGLDSGKVDIHPEIWLPNLDALVERYATDAGTVAISPVGVPAWQGICATRITAEKYGIKDISDLSDPQKTAALDTDGDGRAPCPQYLATAGMDYSGNHRPAGNSAGRPPPDDPG